MAAERTMAGNGEEQGSSCWQDDAEDESGGAPRTSGYWPAALGSRNWAL